MINQYEIYLVNLDPTIGHEIKKSRPCAVISPDEINHSIDTVIIAPMTTKSHKYPTRVEVEFLDKTPRSGESYYYVRVIQLDHNLAWSSPMWIHPQRK